MQINRNNDMGLIVTKEEKQFLVWYLEGRRKKINSIQAEIVMGREFVSHRVKIATLYKVT